MNSFIESKRVNSFRRALIAQIPRFPNDRTSLQALETKSLGDLLIVYIGWRLRYVAQRPRQVTGVANIYTDIRSATLRDNIDALKKVVEAGEDITPYLSLQSHSRGYTPDADVNNSGKDTWKDKDFLLNVMGLHHFHLGMEKEKSGHMKRTNEVIFASVSCEYFDIIGLFNHTVFEYQEDDTLTQERQKLWETYEARQARGALPGQLSIGGFGGLGITLSSHPVQVVLTAQYHARLIQEIDPKLDDPAYVKTLFPQSEPPSRPKFEWNYNHLDLGVGEKISETFIIFHKGPN